MLLVFVRVRNHQLQLQGHTVDNLQRHLFLLLHHQGKGKQHQHQTQPESNESADEDAPPGPLQWSHTSSDINVEKFSVWRGPTKDLGTRATPKDLLNLFINDDYLDEIAWCSVAYAHSKGDESFITKGAEISAYL